MTKKTIMRPLFVRAFALVVFVPLALFAASTSFPHSTHTAQAASITFTYIGGIAPNESNGYYVPPGADNYYTVNPNAYIYEAGSPVAQITYGSGPSGGQGSGYGGGGLGTGFGGVNLGTSEGISSETGCTNAATSAGLPANANYYCVSLGNGQLGTWTKYIFTTPPTIVSENPVPNPNYNYTNSPLLESPASPPAAPAGQSLVCNANNSGCSAYSYTAPASAPSVTLAANPSSISSGNSTALTWIADHSATSCTGSGFSTGGLTSGTVSVSPTSTTNYSVSCTGPGGTGTAATSVTVTAAQVPIPAPPTNVTALCNANGTSVTTSWNPSSGATFYYPRFANVAPSECPSGWQLSGSTCFPNPDTYAGTSVSFPVNPGEAYNFWVHAANATGYSSPTSIGFTCSSNVNIKGGTGPAVNATINQATTLTGTVTNTGSSAAGAFPNILQVCDTGCTNINSVTAATAVNSLAPSASQAISGSYTPTSSTPLTYRFCGNRTPTWQSVIPETDPSDNCGNWQPLNASYLAVGGTCSASPATAAENQTVTWTATPTGGSGTYTYAWGGNVSGTSQTVTQSYPTAGTYTGQVTVTSGGNSSTLQCTPAGGVVIQSCKPSFTATPSTVDAGQSTSLNWSEPSSCASSCTISDGYTGGLNGSHSVTPPSSSGSQTYSVTCGAPGNTAQTTVTVNVPGATLTASPNKVTAGNTTTLTYNANNVNACTITKTTSSGTVLIASPAVTNRTAAGTLTDVVNATSKYLFTCTSGGSSVSAAATVELPSKFQEF